MKTKKFRSSLSAITMSALIMCCITGCDSGSSTETAESSITEAAQETAASETTAAETEGTETTAAETEKEKPASILDDIAEFELSSEDLHDGVWDTAITDTEKGSNQSPQLSWEAVEGAECYAVAMVDTSAGNWLHWKSEDVTETTLPAGWASEKEYIGPYPPSGTHDYEIYVFALRQPAKIKALFDKSNAIFFDNLKRMDTTEDGQTGNLISYGHIKGTYTYGD